MIRGADDRYENSYHPVTKGLAHIDTVEHIINGRGFLTMNLTPYANKTVIYLQVENENEDDKPFWLPEALTDNVNDYGFETEELLNEYLRIPRVYEYIHKVYSLKFGIYKGE